LRERRNEELLWFIYAINCEPDGHVNGRK